MNANSLTPTRPATFERVPHAQAEGDKTHSERVDELTKRIGIGNELDRLREEALAAAWLLVDLTNRYRRLETRVRRAAGGGRRQTFQR